MEEWKEHTRRTVYQGPVFSLVEAMKSHDGNAPSAYTWIESPDWVVVVTPYECTSFVMIRQFRHGLDTVSLEFPGGMVDSHEAPVDAARRELREETGYDAERITLIQSFSPNPAIMRNTLHVFLAEQLTQVSMPNPDEGEILQLCTVARSTLLSHKAVHFSSALMHAALYAYLVWEQQQGSHGPA